MASELIIERKNVKITELTYDPELFPRLYPTDTAGVDWFTAYRYASEMRAGANFPPIVVGIIDDESYPRHGEMIINDGVHRFRAHKKLGLKTIDVIIKHYDSELAFFRDAIEANVTHGRSISFTDKARLLDLLREYGLEDGDISKIILVPMDKIIDLEKRIIQTENGRKIYAKSQVEQALEAGQITAEEALVVRQQRIQTRTAKGLLKQLIDIVRGKLLIPSEDIKALSDELILLLEQYFQVVS